MAVKFIERIKDAYSAFVMPPVNTQSASGSIPFVNILGYEKQYGKPHPQDFLAQIEAYKSWAYACANVNARSVSKCKLCLYKSSINVDGDEELNKIGEHPFLDIIKRPNSFTTRSELFQITQINLELTGNAYWWIPKGQGLLSGIPGAIWNIPSHWMKVVPDPDKFIAGYVCRVPYKGQLIPFDAEDIVHFKFPSPFDLFYGCGPTYASRYGLDLNEQIKTWGINFFMNNATPSGVLMTESALNPDQYARLKDRWNMKYKGAKNAGKIAILESGLKYQQTGSTIKDATFMDISSEVRDEILAMFGVPASKLGLSEHVNRANADTNDYTYQKETVLPRLTLFEETLNERMINLYDSGLICKFESPVQEDENTKAVQRAQNIGCGFTTIDEERIKEGLEPFDLPETSVPLIPFNLTPAGTPKPSMDQYGKPVASGSDPNSEDNKKAFRVKAKNHKWQMFINTTGPQEKLMAGVMKKYFEDLHSDVIGRLNQHKGITKDLNAYILFNMNQANDKLKTKTKPNIQNAVESGVTLGIADVGGDIAFDLMNPNILRAVDARMDFFVEKVNKTTADLISTALQDGLRAGESIADIAKRIDSVFSFSENSRSTRIAQTEIIGATNEGQLISYKNAGVEQQEWITARDELVRDSHQIDGQVVGIDECFVTGLGNLLRYPGDRSTGAPAEDVINCRCCSIAVK